MYRTTQQRISLVADAIIGMMNQYSRTEIRFYALFDYLQLLAQRPLVLTIVEDGPSLVRKYSSLRDPEYVDLLKQVDQDLQSLQDRKMALVSIGQIGKSGHNLWMCLHEYVVSEDSASPVMLRLVADSKMKESLIDQFTELTKLLEEFEQTRILNTIQEMIQRIGKEGAQSVMPGIQISNEERHGMLQPMRGVVDDAITEVLDSPLLRKPVGDGGLDLYNLFCVVRTAVPRLRRGRDRVEAQSQSFDGFNYTAGLLLGEQQIASLQTWRTRPESGLSAEEIFRRIEIPLGEHSRSIADSVFSSGSIDFSGESAGTGRDQSGDESDIQRQQAEDLVYSNIVKQHRVFYIPIHVDGVPWLALFTLTNMTHRADEQWVSWMHNYHVYRTVIPKVAARLRSGAQAVYLRLVGESFANGLRSYSSPEKFLRSVNEAWLKLSCVYPFQSIALRPCQTQLRTDLEKGSTRTLRINETLAVEIVTSGINEFFTRQVSYEVLDVEAVTTVCERNLTSYRETEERVSRNALTYTAHMIRNPIRTMLQLGVGLENAAGDAIVNEASKLLALESTVQSLFASRAKYPADRLTLSRIAGSELIIKCRDQIEKSMKALTFSVVADHGAAIAREILKRRENSLRLFGSARASQGELASLFEFNPFQLLIAVDCLLENGVRYNRTDQPELTVDIETEISADGLRFLTFVVDNPTDRSQQSLGRSIVEMNSGDRRDFVGITGLHLACRACGFPAPRWLAKNGRVCARAVFAVEVQN
jgi:hypothetical protein